METKKEIKITKDEANGITIILPEGYEIDKENSTLEGIKLEN